MPNNGDTSITAVTIKLPEFWINSPEVWFARVEAQFSIRKIIDDTTKYDYTVSALDFKTAEEVQGILIHPPAQQKYQTLKEALVKAFGKSQSQKDSELLNLGGLGDRRPTALLRKINALNDDPITLKRALFLLNLPTDIRSILASQEFETIDKMAEAADRVWETRATSACSIKVNTEHAEPDLQINAFNQRNPNSNQQRSFRANRPPRQPNAQATPNNICYYHNKFGTQARRCAPGCKLADLITPTAVQGNEHAGRK